MKRNKNFFDNNNNGWNDMLTGTYEKAAIHTVEPVKQSGTICVPSNYWIDNKSKIFQTVIIPKDVQVICFNAFTNCETITNIDLPDTITNINTLAFSNCINLTNINIPESLEQFGVSAFSNCVSLTGINLKSNVKFIPPFCFNNCGFSGLLEIPSNIKQIENSSFAGLQISSLKLNEGLETIKDFAFAVCNKLSGNLIIPRSVQYIGYSAFANCNLSKIYINKLREDSFHEYWNKFCNAEIVYY